MAESRARLEENQESAEATTPHEGSEQSISPGYDSKLPTLLGYGSHSCAGMGVLTLGCRKPLTLLAKKVLIPRLQSDLLVSFAI